MGVIRDTCNFFRSVYEGCKGLTPAKRLDIYETFFDYMFYDIERENMRPETQLAFKSTKIALDNSKKKYDNHEQSAQYGIMGAEYGKLGGRPRKNTPGKPPVDESETPKNPVGGLEETPKNPQEEDKDKDIYILSVEEILDFIKKIYKDAGYNKRFDRTDTKKKLLTILKSKNEKRLYPLQVIYSCKAYISEQFNDGKEEQFVKQASAFLTNKVYDYAFTEEANLVFERDMVKKYGDNWRNVKFKYEG